MAKRRMVRVKLLGELGRRFGRYYQLMVLSPREVISALSNQLEGFKEYLSTAHENNVFFKLVSKDAGGMGYEECCMPCDDLVIAPIIAGSGGSGTSVGKILLGVALIGLTFINPIGGATLATIGGKAVTLGSVLFPLGSALLFGGIAELLAPTPNNPEDKDKPTSYLFDRAVDLTTQGLPIPLLYGEYLATAPLVISSSISTEGAPV